MCVNVCVHVHMCVNVCVCGWVICNCVCMWVNPQRYFNFFRILNKHAAAAAASVKRCLPVGFGLDGWRCWWWRGRGSLWPWLWGGEAAHGQGPRWTHWRLALEDFWTTTLLHQNPANPGSVLPLPTQITQFSFCILTLSLSLSLALSLSLCLSHCLSLSFPPPSSLTLFPSTVSSFSWSKSRFICYLAAFSFLTYRCTFSGRFPWLCFLYLLSWGFCVFTYPPALLCTVSLKSLHFKCSKEVFSGLNLEKKSKQKRFGLYVSQNTIKIVSILKRKEQFMGVLDICKSMRL